MITSDDLAFFAVLADSRSLADAARKLDVTPPAVSQRLRALEAQIGVRLIDRNARRAMLTDEGSLVAEHGRRVADAIEALNEALAERTGQVSGHLRVVAPHGFGRLHVAPVVQAFASAHAGVAVTLELSDHPGARLIESCDLAIHIGPQGPPSEIVTTLAPNRRMLCASPAYLERAEAITTPDDLLRHRCLVVRENDEDVTLWRLQQAGHEPATIRIQPAMSSNDGAVVLDWTLAGMGIAMRSEWSVADDLAAGRLRVVLPAWAPPSADVVAMLGARRHGRSARTTAFLAMLRQALDPAPWRQPARARGSLPAQ
ncbi:LysR family transcriptional regulator [Luteimonas sp. RIT-PG2_3]|jgi:DNA-binding transcriptional LysR family regulator